LPEDAAQEKTEQATPRRRHEARERGQVARSHEVNSVAVLLGGVVLLFMAAPAAYRGITDALRYALGDALTQPVTAASTPGLFGTMALKGMGSLAPFACGLLLVGLAAGYGQVGLVLSPQAIQPRLSNLDPVKGFKRLFSLRALMKSVFSMLKLAIIVTVFALAVWSRREEFLTLTESRASVVFGYLCHTIGVVCLQVCGVLAIVALADFGYQHWEHERGLRMTRQELKEEMKRLEGDPLVKSRIRQVQRQMAQRRMMEDLPNADAVVTNPSHYAVALRYDTATMEAPTVVAKGRDRLAERIKEIARQHGIPFVEDRVLARALYRTIEVGEQVPYALYQAVARVLSYVYQLRRRQPARYVPLRQPAAKRGRVRA